MSSGVKDIAQSGMDSAGNVLTKVGHSLTGVPEQEIRTYAKHGPEIDESFKAAEGNIQDMGDTVKRNIKEKIGDYRKAQNDEITEALKTAPQENNIDVSPVMQKLQERMR